MDKVKLLQKEDKLLKNEKSWRRARVGVAFFAILWFLLFASFAVNDPEFREQKSLIYSVAGWVLFWFILFDWLNMRIFHINSIKYYRSQPPPAQPNTPA